jgi:error-prone DNA polymerase
VKPNVSRNACHVGLVGEADRKRRIGELHGRGDQVTHGSGPDSREVLGRKPRDIYIRGIHMDTLKVKSRDFH